MKRIYDTGIDTNQIVFGVNVGTVGTAYTSVYHARTGIQSSKIDESNVDSGNITDHVLGEALNIKSAYLIVRSTIDFSNIGKDQWSNQANNIIIEYHLDGGFSGNQVYDYDSDDKDIVLNGKVVVITKAIELI